MKRLFLLLLLLPLAACMGGGGGGGSDPSPTVSIVDKAAADMEEEEKEEESEGESTSDGGNPDEEEETPTVTPDMDEEEETPTVTPDMDEEEETPTVTDTTDMMAMTPWEKVQAGYLVVNTNFPDMIDVDGIEHRKDMTAPDGIFRYEGEITGEINPSRPYLSDPRITLDYDSGESSMFAQVSFEHEGERSTMARYGASVNADGSFSSFDGLNPRGFDGAFYGDNSFVAGSVSTPRVHGTYVAE